MIGIVCRDLAYLKLLYSVIKQLYLKKHPFVLYHWDHYRAEKEYNRASLENIKKSNPSILKWATKVEPFATDAQLYQNLARDKITKLVSVEMGLWVNKKAVSNIKTYSLCYLTDGLWKDTDTGLHRIYHASEHIMQSHHKFTKAKFNSARDRCLGSPVFDSLTQDYGDGTLVLLPNLRKEHVNQTFGSKDNFIKMIQKIYDGAGPLIFKSRVKQWVPQEILQFAAVIENDGPIMYPPKITELFSICNQVVMFNSSGIYECVVAGKYITNITVPLNRWSWPIEHLKSYFNTSPSSLYQYEGVVESIDQKTILSDDWTFNLKNINQERQAKWISKFIGKYTAGAIYIANDIMRS